MSQNVFYPSLNDICRKHLVTNGSLPILPDGFAYTTALFEQSAALFEQLLLFDKITFKLHGENILAVVLIRMFGQKAFEALIEQKAIAFTLWTPLIAYLRTDIAGVDAFMHGNLNLPAHSDPEQSAELGLDWLAPNMSTRAKRQMVRKLTGLYTPIPEPTLSKKTLSLVKASFRNGGLKNYGLDPHGKQSFDNFSADEKATLCRCTHDLMEYQFMMSREMTSFSEYKYFGPFWGSIDRLRAAKGRSASLQQIARIESFPNLKMLSSKIKEPLKEVVKLRQCRDSVNFRQLVETAVGHPFHKNIVKDYIDSIADCKGLFDSSPGKFVKSIAMAGIEATSGVAVEGANGILWGAGVGKLLGPAADASLDFLIDGLTLTALARGSSPKMFFDDVRKFRAGSEKAFSTGA